jgi:hypothetical protein
MVRALLVRGLLVGVAAAVVAFVVAKLLGESQVDLAIAFESTRDSVGGGHHHEVVSRTTQSTIGLFTGLLMFSVALGGVFSLVYAYAQGRLGTSGVRATAALVALAGFVGVYLLPMLKYPANPPAVGDPETIGRRTALYFLMTAISLIVVVAVSMAVRRLAGQLGGWNAALLSAAGGALAIGVAYGLLPQVNEVPEGFPADVLWRFRIASLAIQASIWATLGLLFGALTERHIRAEGATVDQCA